MEELILREEAEYRLLTSFIYGMQGEIGSELRFCNPETIEQALNITTVVYDAIRLEPCQRNRECVQ
jgi:hypothetical protein